MRQQTRGCLIYIYGGGAMLSWGGATYEEGAGLYVHVVQGRAV